MMKQVIRSAGGCSVLLLAALACTAGAQTTRPDDSMAAPGIIPTGFGEAVDRDVARVRAATAPFKTLEKALAAGYPQTSGCVENQPHGAMGFHHNNKALMDATLEVDKPEVLVYERMADGTYKLNGIEYLVPIPAWTRDEPPTIMGQKLKRADKLGIWYLHVWIWEPSPTGIFADWNPRVKCGA
jgi:hypothetical protein